MSESELALDMLSAQFPRGMTALTSRLVSWHRNGFRVVPMGANSGARAGQKISFQFPSNSIISLRDMTFEVGKFITNNGTAVNSFAGLCPLHDLVDTVNVFCSGVMISTSAVSMNDVYRMKQFVDDNNDRKHSTGFAEGEQYPSAVMVGNAGVGQSDALVWNNILGLPSESSLAYYDASIFGDLRIELVLAPNVVLPRCGHAGATASEAQTVVAEDTAVLNYTLDDFHFHVDCVQLSNNIYGEIMRKRIQMDEFIAINFKNYYTLQNGVGGNTSCTTRFACSSRSIDYLYSTFVDATRETAPTAGQGTYSYPMPPGLCKKNGLAGATADTVAGWGVSKYFFYDSACNFQVANRPLSGQTGNAVNPANAGQLAFDPICWLGTADPTGDMRTQWRVNSVSHPQTPQTSIESYSNQCNIHNNIKQENAGNTSNGRLNHLWGKYLDVCPLAYTADDRNVLNCARTSGFNSKGINTDLQFIATGLDPNKEKTNLVVAECTAELRAGANRSIAVIN
jgi:hypothetical protein